MELEKIDTSTTAGKARVMQLAAEGRKLASRSLLPGYSWAECPAPVWDWSAGEYAIIANLDGPDEVWVTVANKESVVDVYSREEHAHPRPSQGWSIVRYIRADLAEKSK